jgi:ferrochelatase
MLLNFGGPQSLAEVRPFLRNMFRDENILPVKSAFLRRIAAWFFSRIAARASIPKYMAIGGGSPLVEITLKQAAALQEELAHRGRPMKVYAGMRYSAPGIRDAALKAFSDGARRFIVIPLYPHFSTTTTESAVREFLRVVKDVSETSRDKFVMSYENAPGYVKALARKLQDALEDAGSGGEAPIVLFSAHSLPARILNKDNSYLEQIKTTAELVAQAVGLKEYKIAYQSGRKGWLGPTVEGKLQELAGKGCKSVVVVPLSFTCDNIETLYDIDIKLKAEADRLGVTLRRTESLNDSPAFIAALADIVLEKL